LRGGGRKKKGGGKEGVIPALTENATSKGGANYSKKLPTEREWDVHLFFPTDGRGKVHLQEVGKKKTLKKIVCTQ